MKTNLNFCFLLVMMITGRMLSQDTIVLRSGEHRYGKVIEFGTYEIKYKKTDSLEGSTYSEPKTQVLEVRFRNGIIENIEQLDQQVQIKKEEKKAQERSFFTGRVQSSDEKLIIRGGTFVYKGVRLNSDELRGLAQMRNDPELSSLVRQSWNNKAAYVATFAGVPVVFAGAGILAASMFGQADPDTGIIVTAIGSLIVDANIVLSIRGKRLKKKIAKRYNETF